MVINKLNYETYALDYLEGTLSMELMVEMKQFLEQNPEIEAEFLAYKSIVVSPDESIVYEGKEQLKRPPIVAKIPFVTWSGWLFSGILLVLLSWQFIKSQSESNTAKQQEHITNSTIQKPLGDKQTRQTNTSTTSTEAVSITLSAESTKKFNINEKQSFSTASSTLVSQNNHTNTNVSLGESNTISHSILQTRFSSSEEKNILGFGTTLFNKVIDATTEITVNQQAKGVNLALNLSENVDKNVIVENTVQPSIMTLAALSSILSEEDGKDWYTPEDYVFKKGLAFQMSMGYVEDLGRVLPSDNSASVGTMTTLYATELQGLLTYQFTPDYALQTGVGLTLRPLYFQEIQLNQLTKPTDLDILHTTISIPVYLTHAIPFRIDKAPRFCVTIGGAWNKTVGRSVASKQFAIDGESFWYEERNAGSSFSFYNGLEYLLMNNPKQGRLGIEVGYHHQFGGISSSQLWTYDIENQNKINLVQEQTHSFKSLIFRLKYTPKL